MYRQPRVPQLREKGTEDRYAKELMLFLRDFCLAAWNADRKKDEEHSGIRRRLEALEKKES